MSSEINPAGGPSRQSKGGRARADKLSAEQRRAIAATGAEARWARLAAEAAGRKVPNTICGAPDRPLRIGDIEIPCYVLEGGRRVLHQRGMVSALGMSRGGSSRGGGDRLAYFVAQKTLETFVPKHLVEVTREPILFRTPRGALAYGYDATVLADICEAVLAARKAGKLSERQQGHIAEKAEILVRGFARVGIIALVDEATGYQEQRARDELHRILEAYIAKELLPWTRRFPDEFYKEMFRVWGWQWPPVANKGGGPRGPRYAGKLTRQIVYGNLPDGVLAELERNNPADDNWQRRHRFTQQLTTEIGQPHLDKLVAQITMLFRLADDKATFWRLYRKAFPRHGDQMELGLEDGPEDDAG